MVKVFDRADKVLTALAEFTVLCARQSVERTSRFNFVLSGGSSPKKLFEMLAAPPFREQIEWTKVFFFFGDERYVPADHADSNFRMARTTLLDPLGIPAHQVFAVNTALEPSACAADYEKRIREHFGNEPLRFDLILLGLGDDAHTASLFPYTDVLKIREPGIANNFVQKLGTNRITFTSGLINLAYEIAFLVYGAGKADAIRHVLEDAPDIQKYPAQAIGSGNENVIWFIDEAAASQLKKTPRKEL